MAVDDLVVAGESTNTRACKPYSLSGLLTEGDRGENEPMPYADGEIAYYGFLSGIDDTFEWRINGFWTPAGAVNADVSDGLDDNLEFYRALFRDGGDAAGRKTVTLHTGNRALGGLMQCRRWVPVRTGPGTMTVVTRLVVPAGRLVAP